jgi:hypothetical protein
MAVSTNCFIATFRRFSAKATRRGVAPPGRFTGQAALDKFAGDLPATHPHFVYTPHGEPQALHNAGRLAWGSGPRDEAPDYTGLDVIIVRGGKIAALYVFLDSMPS